MAHRSVKDEEKQTNRLTPDEALRQYRRAVKELLEARTIAGGDLPQDEEDRYCDELDDYWFQMTDEEHRIIEMELAKLSEKERSGKNGI